MCHVLLCCCYHFLLTQWQSIPSLICQESVFVSEPTQLPQNNWLITQYISTTIPPQSISYSTVIHVNITYQFAETCSPEVCYPGLHLMMLFSNDSNDTAANTTANYTCIADYMPTSTSDLQFSTVTFPVRNQRGFYLALHDNGTNVTVSRILVYRLKGPAKQVNLTLFPETPAPVSGSITVTGQCVANAKTNTTSGNPPSVTLDSKGKWSNPEMCLCIEGHQPEMLAGSLQCQGEPIAVLTTTCCMYTPAVYQWWQMWVGDEKRRV